MYLSTRSFHFEFSLDNLMVQFFDKFPAAFYRLIAILQLVPRRVKRLLQHTFKLIYANQKWNARPDVSSRLEGTLEYIVKWLIYFLAIFGVAEIYETLSDFLKFNTRPLTDWETDLAQTIFGNSIDYKKVRIDEHAFIGPKQQRFAYVGFNTMNSWGPMHQALFLHEMTHVYQYQKLGAVYIYDALKAQHSEVGYNYGGITALKNGIQKGKKFSDFNLEQQGDIVSDYFRIKNGYAPQWGDGNLQDVQVYEAYLGEIQSESEVQSELE